MHEAKLTLKSRHHSEFADEIEKELISENKRYDRSRVRSLDMPYIDSLRPNYHQIVPNTLIAVENTRGLTRHDPSKNYVAARKQRNMADYDLSLIFRYQDSNDVVNDIQSLISTIASL